MELIDVTLRESVFCANKMTCEGRLEYLSLLCDTLPNTMLKYVEASFIDTDIVGELNYNPHFIADAHKICNGTFKLAAMLHPDRADISLWDPKVIELLDMVRITVPLGKLDAAKPYIDYLHRLGVKVSCNLLYTASVPLEEILSMEHQADTLCADFFCCADSSGSFSPAYTRALSSALTEHRGNLQVGLHLHDHMHMALANTLIALDCGIEMGDVSITGAGKGGGNAKMEEALLTLTPKESITPALLEDIYSLIQAFDRLSGFDSVRHSLDFFNFLTGLFRLNLKDAARLERLANGDASVYFKELLR